MYFFPDQPFIMRVRGRLYGLLMQGHGSNFQVSSNVILRTLENIRVGDHVYLAPGVIINAGDKVFVDDEVMIGFNSIIAASNHTIFRGSYRFGCSTSKPIELLYGSWVGANCTILSGSVLPKSSVLGAGSVLNSKNVEEGLYVGTPARYVKSLVNY
ncbi:acyltransferase [Vibrio breoganii]